MFSFNLTKYRKEVFWKVMLVDSVYFDNLKDFTQFPINYQNIIGVL
jgi:hypothetical protein